MIASVPFGRQEYLQNVTSERQSLLQEARLSTEDVDGWLVDLKRVRKSPANQGNASILHHQIEVDGWLMIGWLMFKEDCTALLCLKDVVGIMTSAGLKNPY